MVFGVLGNESRFSLRTFDVECFEKILNVVESSAGLKAKQRSKYLRQQAAKVLKMDDFFKLVILYKFLSNPIEMRRLNSAFVEFLTLCFEKPIKEFCFERRYLECVPGTNSNSAVCYFFCNMS